MSRVSVAALREVYAHATLNRMGAHENVVRYYSVWREEDHLYIQNEYCDGGCLDVRHVYPEDVLRNILHQVAKVRHGAARLNRTPGLIPKAMGESETNRRAWRSSTHTSSFTWT